MTELHINRNVANFPDSKINRAWHGEGQPLSYTTGMLVTGLLVKDVEYSENNIEAENVPAERNEKLVLTE